MLPAASRAVTLHACTPSASPAPTPRVTRWPALAAPTLDGKVLDPRGHDITIRMLSMERPHRAVPMTGAMGLAVACRVEGSIPHALMVAGPRPEEIRVAHASGTVAVGAEVRRSNTEGWFAESAVVFRTARRLMQGQVTIPT